MGGCKKNDIKWIDLHLHVGIYFRKKVRLLRLCQSSPSSRCSFSTVSCLGLPKKLPCKLLFCLLRVPPPSQSPSVLRPVSAPPTVQSSAHRFDVVQSAAQTPSLVLGGLIARLPPVVLSLASLLPKTRLQAALLTLFQNVFESAVIRRSCIK